MSSASIVGLAVLETPRQVAGHGMTLQFDAQFYLAPGQKMLASLRYFNLYNQTFDDVGMYFVWANIARMFPTIPRPSDEIEPEEYQIVGDIIWLIPATGCDPRQRPWLSVTGVATNINSKDATFDIDAFQYTHGVAEATKDNRKAGVLPIRAIIPDSARYKTKKPIPSQNSYVAVVGFLSRFDLAENGYPDRFHIDVENVTFLGKSVLPARPANTPVKTPTPGSKKSGRLRFNFDDVFNDAPPSSSPLATPSRNDQPESENTQADETFATSDGPALEYADPSPNGNATLIPLKRQLESTVTPLSNTTNLKRVARRG